MDGTDSNCSPFLVVGLFAAAARLALSRCLRPLPTPAVAVPVFEEVVNVEVEKEFKISAAVSLFIGGKRGKAILRSTTGCSYGI